MTFDAKFTKLEKTVEKIHSDIKRSFNEPDIQNLNPNINNIQVKAPENPETNEKDNENSLSLNFEKEKENLNKIDLKDFATPKIIKDVKLHDKNNNLLF